MQSSLTPLSRVLVPSRTMSSLYCWYLVPILSTVAPLKLLLYYQVWKEDCTVLKTLFGYLLHVNPLEEYCVSMSCCHEKMSSSMTFYEDFRPLCKTKTKRNKKNRTKDLPCALDLKLLTSLPSSLTSCAPQTLMDWLTVIFPVCLPFVLCVLFSQQLMCYTCQASNCHAPRHAIGQKNPRSARWIGLDTSRLFIIVADHCSLQLIQFPTRLIIFRRMFSLTGKFFKKTFSIDSF